MFLTSIGKTSLAIAVLGLPACSADDSDAAAGTTQATTPPATDTPPTTTTAATAATATTAPSTLTTTSAAPLATDASFERIPLGNVSAYLLIRSGEIGIIDTGNPGSENAIADAITGLGLAWTNVGHIGVTHAHGDHAGSLASVAELASGAVLYAAAPDLRSMNAPRPIQEISDGSSLFGMTVVATPGHTEGHICFLDTNAGILFAGDALNGTDGGVGGANARFTSDIAEADNSVRKLAQLSYETILFGHGEPVLALGDQQVAALAASL